MKILWVGFVLIAMAAYSEKKASPLLIPAVEVKAGPVSCSSITGTGSKQDCWMPEHVTCADKSHILLHAEDDTFWCLATPKSPLTGKVQ